MIIEIATFETKTILGIRRIRGVKSHKKRKDGTYKRNEWFDWYNNNPRFDKIKSKKLEGE